MRGLWRLLSAVGTTGSVISRIPSFLIGLAIIGVIGGGAFVGWKVWSGCQGQTLGACLFSALNPVPKSYGRTAGGSMGCSGDEEQDGALCYPRCKAGYKGAGPVCWQSSCPAGFRDDGAAFCEKPAPYDRGAGYPWKGSDGISDNGMFSRCRAENPQGCEKSGVVVYPNCKPNFHPVGCCVCSPDCPGGMGDAGVSCAKANYGRTAGVPLHACPSDKERDGLFCYPKCKAGYKGVGPVCWEQKT